MDIKTLILCIFILQSLLLVMRIVVFYGRFRDGITYWTTAGCIEVAMWALIISGGKANSALVGSLALFGFSIGASCLLLSLTQFFELVPNKALIVATAITASAFTFLGQYEFTLATVLLNALLGFISARCIQVLWRQRSAETIRSNRLLMVGFVLFSATAFLRAAEPAIHAQGVWGVNDGQPLRTASLLSAFLSGILINVGFLLLHQDRAWHRHQLLAMSDSLTGLLNRRALDFAAKQEVQRAQRQKYALVVAILDIDFFKKINDSYGHPVGDQALQLFAQLLQKQFRQTDIVARYGGEEFCVILPLGNVESLLNSLNRLKEALESSPLEPQGVYIRFSGGVSVWALGETSLEAAIARADAALYQAKKQGRDRVVVADMTVIKA